MLLIDDFLANGKALEGLAALVRDSGAELVGAGIVIEKGFQVGGDLIRSEGSVWSHWLLLTVWMRRQEPLFSEMMNNNRTKALFFDI